MAARKGELTMARKPASIVPLIDVSGSMADDNFIGGARVAADAFIHFFQSGDLFAIFAFNQSVRTVYPANGQLIAFTSQQVLTDASNAIFRLQPGGQTNMGDAILRGVSLLKPQAAPTGIVLLSDGKPNVGPNAVDSCDANIRTYTVGLGPGTDPTVMRQIAEKTSATFLFTATPKGLNSIYFDIIGKADVAQLVSNAVRQEKEFRITVPLQAGLPDATIGVAWPETSIEIGTGPNQIQVTILDPESQPYKGPFVYLRRGYVIFPIDKPEAGDWVVKVKYQGDHPPAITAAAVDPTQSSRMLLRAPDRVPAGAPIVIHAELQHEGTPVRSLSGEASAEVPLFSIGEVIDANRDALRSMAKRDGEEDDSEESPDLVRFRKLHGTRLATEDIFPHRTVAASVRAADKGQQEVRIPTEKPGLYTVNVVCAGEHPNGGRFQRTELVTVEVI
jgi:hypothetical protein